MPNVIKLMMKGIQLNQEHLKQGTVSDALFGYLSMGNKRIKESA